MNLDVHSSCFSTSSIVGAEIVVWVYTKEHVPLPYFMSWGPEDSIPQDSNREKLDSNSKHLERGVGEK